ncbi:MAG: hypothetical protein ACRDTC_08680 [Pseudonocardiaceae bacterium]
MIDLDPWWRLMIATTALGMLPLLLTLGWVARRISGSCTAVLLRSWWRGRFRRRPRRRRPPTPGTSTPVRPGRPPDAPHPAVDGSSKLTL